MDSIDRLIPKTVSARRTDDERSRDVRALWSAIRAERRALDERTARLRMMTLLAGDEGRT